MQGHCDVSDGQTRCTFAAWSPFLAGLNLELDLLPLGERLEAVHR